MGDQYGDLKEYNMTKHNVISWYDLKVFNVKKEEKKGINHTLIQKHKACRNQAAKGHMQREKAQREAY